MKKLSIVVPVYNEEKTIYEILNKICSKEYGVPYEVLVIDDGSTDKTIKQIEKVAAKYSKIRIIRCKKNRGKGHAIKVGIASASGDYIIFQDADVEYNPTEIKKFIEKIKRNNLIALYGSRFKGACHGMKTSNLLANKLLTFLTNILFSSSLTDMETCYKMIKTKELRSLKLKSNRFEIEAEITAKLLKKGIKIEEIAISYTARTKEEGKKISWNDGFKNVKVLLKEKLL